MRSRLRLAVSLLLPLLSLCPFLPGSILANALANEDVVESARLFGKMPAVWGLRLSPDGTKVSFLRQHDADMPLAMVIDLKTGKGNIVLASDKGEVELVWCDWANETRLLCGYRGVARVRGDLYAASRLVAVNDDSSEMKVLVQKQLRDQEWAYHQALIVDWLPDDPKHILLATRDGNGRGVDSLDIYRNRLRTVERPRIYVWDWISDGHGNLRLRRKVDERYDEWLYRPAPGSDWERLHRSKAEDLDDHFWPIGFGRDLDKLLVGDQHEGRQALFVEDLSADRKRTLLFAHPEVDIDGVALRIGKHRRLVGVSYSTDKPRFHAFDERVRQVLDLVGEALPGETIWLVSESWDGRYYLVHAESDLSPGSYYRFDATSLALARITNSYPHLEDEVLAPMKPMSYPADDGVSIPAYLTLPTVGAGGPRPTVILPHGGPQSRDEWGFDWLAQFLAHRGYAVLQSNFRGSGGYGSAWAGEGGFREWERAVADLESGAQALVEKGIADPDRMCILGWSYGGYAALMSSIQYPERYRCVVSIAGVTDPWKLAQEEGHPFFEDVVKEFVGRDVKTVERGSPRWRASEIRVPVLLFHGDEDVNVSIDQSRWLEKELKGAEKGVELVEYEDVEHSIRREQYRIDMLTRIGEFLEENLAPRHARLDPE